MWTIFKVFIELVTIASGFFFYFSFLYVLVFWPLGMWDLSYQSGIKPVPPAPEGKVPTIGPLGKSLFFLHF